MFMPDDEPELIDPEVLDVDDELLPAFVCFVTAVCERLSISSSSDTSPTTLVRSSSSSVMKLSSAMLWGPCRVAVVQSEHLYEGNKMIFIKRKETVLEQ